MKILLEYLLGLFLLFMFFKPCTDVTILKSESSLNSVQYQTEHAINDSDSCSPLCNCLCCNTLITETNSFTLNFNNNYSTTSHYGIFGLISNPGNPNSPPPRA